MPNAIPTRELNLEKRWKGTEEKKTKCSCESGQKDTTLTKENKTKQNNT